MDVSASRASRSDCERDLTLASLARQAAQLCDAQIGLVSLLDDDEQRIVGCFGVEVDRVARTDAVCAYTVLQPDVFVVEDARLDPRFAELPFVVGSPNLRFYAGAPFFDESDVPLGTVCVIDSRPHAVSSQRLHALGRLASLAATVFELREVHDRALAAPMSPEAREALRRRQDRLLLTLVDPRPPRE